MLKANLLTFNVILIYLMFVNLRVKFIPFLFLPKLGKTRIRNMTEPGFSRIDPAFSEKPGPEFVKWLMVVYLFITYLFYHWPIL